MSLQQNKVPDLEHTILAEAWREARQILNTAEAQADEITHQAKITIAAEEESILQHAREQVDLLQSQAAAMAHLEAQNLKLQRREQLLISAFSEAETRMQQAPQWTTYPNILRQLLCEAIAKLDTNELRVHADIASQEVIEFTVMLDTLSQELSVRLYKGEPLTKGTGIVVETLDGHRRYDNTLQTRLVRMRETLRAQVYHMLRGIPRSKDAAL